MHREPPTNPITLALATILHSCPSVRPLLTPVPIRSQCLTLPIKSFSTPSYVSSSLLASEYIPSFLSGLTPYICPCLFTTWPFTTSTRGASDILQGPTTGVWTPARMGGIAGLLSISGPRVRQQWMLPFPGMRNSIWSRYVLGERLEVKTGRISSSVLINIFCPPGHSDIHLPNKGRLYPSRWLSKTAGEGVRQPSWDQPRGCGCSLCLSWIFSTPHHGR